MGGLCHLIQAGFCLCPANMKHPETGEQSKFHVIIATVHLFPDELPRKKASAHECVLRDVIPYPKMNTHKDLRLHAHPRPVLHRLRNMIRRDQVATGEVDDGTRKLQNAMIGTSREVQLLYSSFHELLRRRLDLAKLAYLGWPHFGVAGDFGATEPLQLALAGRLCTLANGFGGLDLSFIGQFLIIPRGTST